jgi:hypothetical protein
MVSSIIVISAFAIVAALSLKYGVDSRFDDGRPNL